MIGEQRAPGLTGALIAFLSARLDEDKADAPNQPDRARALREVTAKREILSRYAAEWEWVSSDDVRSLAAVWSDHPDYREEMKLNPYQP